MNIFYLVCGIAVSTVLLTWLALRGNRKYSVHDTEAHSTTYAETIKEGHGGLTLFLWVSFTIIFIWTIVYLVLHWSEFGVIFSG